MRGFLVAMLAGALLASGAQPQVTLNAAEFVPVITTTPDARPPSVTLVVEGEWAWALRDRETGETIGSANRATFTSSTE